MNEEEFLNNYKVFTLYVRKSEKGAYMTVVFQEMSVSAQIKLAIKAFVPRGKSPADTTSYEIIKLKKGAETESVKLSKFGIENIKIFNKIISSLQLEELSSTKISLNSLVSIEELAKTVNFSSEIIQAIQNNPEIIQAIQNDPELKDDIIAIQSRKDAVKEFKEMLENNSTTEDQWQKFFKSNEWIFGYGLDYRFCHILQESFSASTSNIDGKGDARGDYLLADRNFTVFVEIKKSVTRLFRKSRNRSGAWGLSSDLFDAISQIIEYKASGQIKMNSKADNYVDGKKMQQKTCDPKVILVIGDLSELNDNTDQEKDIKMKTFELFRREIRNVEILTFDELLDRARSILEYVNSKSNNE